MSRKNKCKENVDDTVKQNEPLGKQNEPLAKQNEPLNKQNEPICEYCFKKFFNKQSISRHYDSCKAQKDPIRQLEIQAEIIPKVPENSTECRFCNKVLSSKTKLNKHTCQQKQDYHNNLKRTPQTINNNGTINNFNGTVNNIYINGQESVNNLKIDCVIEELIKINKTIRYNAYAYLKAGTWITAVDNMIRSQPENQNVQLTEKAMSGKYLTAQGWVTESADCLLERCFQQTAIRLKELENRIIKPFLIKNKDTWGEVGHFARTGLNWDGQGGSAVQGDQVRRVRTGFKVNLCRYAYKRKGTK